MLQLLFPRVCPVCGKTLSGAFGGNREENPYICPGCHEKLPFPKGSRCLLCSRVLQDEQAEYCPDCARSRPWFDQGISLLLHEDPAKQILYELKYSNKRDHADMLGWEAARQLADFIRRWDPQVILPVPLHRKRERQRGFNQAEVLAKRLSFYLAEQQIHLPVKSGLLIRTAYTRAQKELDPEERRRNLRGAFSLSCALPYKKVLLADDIYTTGATLSECARVLKEAGAQQVHFLTFSIV